MKSASMLINAAGALKPKDCEDNRDEAVRITKKNVEFIFKILSLLNAKKILHVSSAGTVYGEGIGKKYVETDPLNPISAYGYIKVLEEEGLEKYSKENGISYVCARLSNPYGNKTTKKHGLIDVFIKSARDKKPVSIYMDRNPSRDYIHITDAARYIVKLLLSELEGIFNVCSGESLKVSEILNLFEGSCIEVVVEKTIKAPSFDVIENNLCNNKIKALFPLERTVVLSEYIHKFI